MIKFHQFQTNNSRNPKPINSIRRLIIPSWLVGSGRCVLVLYQNNPISTKRIHHKHQKHPKTTPCKSHRNKPSLYNCSGPSHHTCHQPGPHLVRGCPFAACETPSQPPAAATVIGRVVVVNRSVPHVFSAQNPMNILCKYPLFLAGLYTSLSKIVCILYIGKFMLIKSKHENLVPSCNGVNFHWG